MNQLVGYMKKVNKNQKSVEVADRIYDAAEKNFALWGYAGARMDQIAQDAGVNKATIYYHHGGKRALYEKALEKAFGALTSNIIEKTTLVIAAEDRLRAYVKSIVYNLCSSDRYPSIILHEVASGGANLPNEIIDEITSMTGVLGSILSKGVLETRFKLADVAIILMMIVGCVNLYIAGTSIREKVSKGRIHKANRLSETPKAMSEQIIDIIINGLKTTDFKVMKGK